MSDGWETGVVRVRLFLHHPHSTMICGQVKLIYIPVSILFFAKVLAHQNKGRFMVASCLADHR